MPPDVARRDGTRALRKEHPLDQVLVVVESPAKARTIKKYLGKGYSVKASVGHIRDLPQRELGYRHR